MQIRSGESRKLGQALISVVDRTVNKSVLKLIGFKVILAWHYLILFSPILIGEVGADTTTFFFERQLTLYCSLAAAFASIILIDRIFLRKRKVLTSSIVLGLVGVIAVLSTLFSVFLLSSPNTTLRLIVTVFLGFSEAYLMFFWLRFYQKAAGKSLYKSFAFDMIVGTILGILICVLQTPFSYGAVVALPLLATISLFLNWHISGSQTEQTEPQLEKPIVALPKKSVFRYFLMTILPTVVYAFVFGLLQGSYVADGIVLMMATEPIILLGISMCGIFLMLTPEDPVEHSDIDTIHRVSLVLFTLGIVGLTFFQANTLVVSETAILAGFNLFDFGAMILGIGVAKTLRLKGSTFLNGGRALTYLSLAAGFGFGFAAMKSVPEEQKIILLAISGLSIIFLVATTLTPFRKIGIFESAIFESLMEKDKDLGQGNTEREVKNEDATSCNRGPDLQSKSSTFIQKKKGYVGVKKGEAGVVVVGKSHTPCLQCEGCKAPGTSVSHETKKANHACKDLDKVQLPPKDLSGRNPKIKTNGNGSVAEISSLNTPWKRVCQETATLYRLSPRETEIFLLLAKGRNADYIQQRLYISTHTAKTHIANIYRKLEVHSLQEMLDLVELFKEQGKVEEKVDE